MKFYKFLTLILFITATCLFYVYQQTQIYCLAYVGEKRIEDYQDLLDKNNILRYNVNVITSLPSIGQKILEASDFEMPQVTKVVRLQTPQENKVATVKKRLAFILDIFSLKSQAEAKTIGH